jgi:hypothetical protein
MIQSVYPFTMMAIMNCNAVQTNIKPNGVVLDVQVEVKINNCICISIKLKCGSNVKAGSAIDAVVADRV